MSQNELIAIALPIGLGVIGFFIRQSVAGVTTRLDKLEGTLETLVKQVVASATRQDVNGAEIEKLREKVHSIEAEVVAISAIQERCRSCSPRS